MPTAYPPEMPPEDRRRHDAVEPSLRPMLIELWHAAQAYEARLAAGEPRAVATEQAYARAAEEREMRDLEAFLERVLGGERGDVGRQMAEEMLDQALPSTTRRRLLEEIRQRIRPIPVVSRPQRRSA